MTVSEARRGSLRTPANSRDDRDSLGLGTGGGHEVFVSLVAERRGSRALPLQGRHLFLVSRVDVLVDELAERLGELLVGAA